MKTFLLVKLQIEGESMHPTFKKGEIVLASSFSYFFRKPQVNDAVILKRNGKLMIKRIKEAKGGRYYVVGDNEKKSTDSRTFGWLKRKEILGKVIYSIPLLGKGSRGK